MTGKKTKRCGKRGPSEGGRGEDEEIIWFGKDRKKRRGIASTRGAAGETPRRLRNVYWKKRGEGG